ncbi:MAG: glycosyltransferase family 2 protein [Paludibacteraceae bacterium]|nr:glycosyltransferase family 2 protein [Paludibacteraceae bacterium]
MKTNPLVSIIMPAYNASAYIAEAIESVLDQTWTNWELIIVDDGSTDDTLQIVRQFAAQDNRIQVYHQANQGGCVARNTALKHIIGDYIQYLDADDKLERNKLSLQLNTDLDEDTIVYGSCLRLLANGQCTKASMWSLCQDYVPAVDAQVAIWENHLNSFPYSTYLLPRKLVMAVGNWNESLMRAQDCEYMARVLALAKQLLYVPDAIFYYRQVENSVSGKPLSQQQLQSEALVCDVIADVILSHSKSIYAKRACEIHYTDVLTAWYPQNRFLVKDMVKSMNVRGLNLNFENRGRLFHMLKNIFGWRVAVRIIKLKNIIRL